MVRGLEEEFRVLLKFLSGFCHLDPACGSMQEPDPQIVLERLYLPAQSRLSHVEPRGGLAKTSSRDNAQKIPELLEFQLPIFQPILASRLADLRDG